MRDVYCLHGEVNSFKLDIVILFVINFFDLKKFKIIFWFETPTLFFARNSDRIKPYVNFFEIEKVFLVKIKAFSALNLFKK